MGAGFAGIKSTCSDKTASCLYSSAKLAANLHTCKSNLSCQSSKSALSKLLLQNWGQFPPCRVSCYAAKLPLISAAAEVKLLLQTACLQKCKSCCYKAYLCWSAKVKLPWQSVSLQKCKSKTDATKHIFTKEKLLLQSASFQMCKSRFAPANMQFPETNIISCTSSILPTTAKKIVHIS